MNVTERSLPPHRRHFGLRLSLALVCLAAAALVATIVFTVARLRPHPDRQLRLATTSTVRLRYLAKQMTVETNKHDLEVTLVSEEAAALELIDRVNCRGVDLALLPGGLKTSEAENVRQIASLDIVPLHLLVRSELSSQVSSGIAALRGKKVNLNAAGGVAAALGQDVLRFAGGLSPIAKNHAGDFIASYHADEEVVDQLNQIERLSPQDRAEAVSALPDAFFTVSPLPSVVARKLVSIADYRLVPLPFGQAFTVACSAGEGECGESLAVQHTCMTEIPAYLYGRSPPVPPQPYPTIGVRLLLVGHRDIDPTVVEKILEVINEPPLVGVLKPTSLKDQLSEYDFHRGAALYLRRNEPIVSSQLLAHLGSAIGGVGAFIGGMVAFSSVLRILKLRRFEGYYDQVREIELVATGAVRDPQAPSDPAELRAYLERKLSELKCRALEEFAAGGLKGEGLMHGIVALVNDTRQSLPRLQPPLENGERQSGPV